MMANKAIYSKEDNNKIEILAMLTKLRQICIDPRLLYEDIINVSTKIQASIELIEKSIENKEKVILFSNFTSVLDSLSQELNKINIDYYTLTGSTNKIMRKRLVDDFQSDDTSVFLISLKAGGTGLNLTKASVIIHIDPWWNLSVQNQATDRAYRIGQKNVVQVFNLITKDTIEEKIQKLQLSMKDLSDIFVENSKGSFDNISKEDLLELFKY
ncbi:DEAD/DEAH box helicase [Helcococcus ovis]|uniref:DEAD/DEAH box helicase n=1 Tax=Helcococcus ovis TaxID=72026 RepID=UPI001ADB22A6|nr:C-terminal helicase domain-containing protein [Helcococcus ovis]